MIWIGIDKICGAFFSKKVSFLANIGLCSSFVDKTVVATFTLKIVEEGHRKNFSESVLVSSSLYVMDLKQKLRTSKQTKFCLLRSNQVFI